jgi:orotate phosphoribosyltransferase-like protein
MERKWNKVDLNHTGPQELADQKLIKVIECMDKGFSTAETARELGLKRSTVYMLLKRRNLLYKYIKHNKKNPV